MHRPVALGFRRGVTLLELLVVVVLLGLGAALVAPALRVSGRPQLDPLQEALQAARRDAVRRGETVQVRRDDGQWDVTPAGLCLPAAGPAEPGAWDPVRCAPADQPLPRR